MATQTQTATAPEPEWTAEEKIQQLREWFADAPEVGKKALVGRAVVIPAGLEAGVA